jgi:hypothetical protein
METSIALWSNESLLTTENLSDISRDRVDLVIQQLRDAVASNLFFIDHVTSWQANGNVVRLIVYFTGGVIRRCEFLRQLSRIVEPLKQAQIPWKGRDCFYYPHIGNQHKKGLLCTRQVGTESFVTFVEVDDSGISSTETYALSTDRL